MEFLPTGYLATAGNDGPIKLWDPFNSTNLMKPKLFLHNDRINALTDLSLGRLASLSLFSIKIWNITSGTVIRQLSDLNNGLEK